ncbi:MAG: mannonate dehydratase [Candidatus Moranbacteria bacterium GW2011_GWA2_39_41]|nr:MAG: mannonate dehydratase [Candidatus Moranbacteria bacterium GW2011_GWA2_39_41]
MNILKKILKVVGIIIAIILGFVVIMFGYFNLPIENNNDSAKLGMTFSNKYAYSIGLDWKANYIAMLDDLHIKKIRIPVYWDLVESKQGEYDFSDVDWQLNEARKRNAEIILAIGQKTPRWPECNIPAWAMKDDQTRKENLLKYVDVTVRRYKDDPVVKFWQIENEPFLPFGICPAIDPSLLDSELAVARSIDNTRKIIVTDSGELSLWIQAAKRADIFGTTMYRTIYKKEIGYFEYPIGPRFFQVKHNLIQLFARQNNAIVIELQAEPWISGSTTDNTLEEQFKSMNPAQLVGNVDYAEKVGFPQIYLWGVEWWYWLKEKQNHPELWNTAKVLYNNRQ